MHSHWMNIIGLVRLFPCLFYTVLFYILGASTTLGNARALNPPDIILHGPRYVVLLIM